MNLRRRHALFGACCLLATAAQGGAVRGLIDYSRQEASASHLVLIPLVSAALLYRSRERIFSSVTWSAIPAACLGAFGASLWLLAAERRFSSPSEDWLTPGGAALVVSWIAGFLLCYGPRASRAALFPLMFLGFTIPIPAVVLDSAVAVLKSGTAEVVEGLFVLTGTAFQREGFVFWLSSIAIEIADDCSGIRSSIALLLTSLLAAHLSLNTLWTKSLLVLFVLPVAVLKNGVRIVNLSLLAMHVDPRFLTGQLHREGGVLYFLLALVMLVPVYWILRRFEGSVSRVRAVAGASALVVSRP